MFFHIEHTTEYVYPEPATESFSELRLRPRDSLRQRVSHHSTHVQPSVVAESYVDYFGNVVETISIPFRHTGLVVRSVCDVETNPFSDALSGLYLTIIGWAASHAWVEIFSPNEFWVGLDPSNNILEGERHVQIGIGRDYHDGPPLQGIFKGRKQQSLNVQVRVMRTEVTPEERPLSLGT